jgi:deoxycytidine triphosphate deaminase
MLNRDEIKTFGIIAEGAASDEDEKSWRATSYDVRVGTILAVESDGKSRLSEANFCIVPPQGMVEVISLETIKVPENVAGYASVLTRLSRRGLLALNTGIIDPSYEGPLSAVMVNFGRTAFSLSSGDSFLRLTFHQHTVPDKFKPILRVERQEFLRERKKEAGERFSESFLDIAAHIDEIAKGAFWRYLGRAAVLVGLVALMVTLVTWGVTLGVAHWQGGFLSKDQIRAAVDEYFQSDDFKSLKSGLTEIKREDLHEEVRLAVERALANSQPKAVNSTAPGGAEKLKRTSRQGGEQK